MNYAEMKTAFLRGWHTWNVRSVLSHVHMPDGFALNIALKEYRDGHYLKETLWDEENGFYYNRRTDTGAFSRRISPTNFYALFSPDVTPEHQRRMADEHYFNSGEFYGEWMLPSIAFRLFGDIVI